MSIAKAKKPAKFGGLLLKTASYQSAAAVICCAISSICAVVRLPFI